MEKTPSIPAEVFSETINILGRQIGHLEAMGTAKILINENSSFIYHPTSRQVLANALERFGTIPQGVSFTDCVVMAYADEYKTKEIFGFDKAFETAGYKTLMQPKNRI